MDENNRFRRALKSPLVMSGLCILAGIAVYYNVIESTLDSTLPVSVASTPSPVSTPVSPSLMAHEEGATSWIEHPARDPFTPMSLAKWSNPSSQPLPASASVTQRPHTPSPNNLMLKAVAIEAEQRSAVINHQVVYEGEMIEGYQVVSIQLKGVWIQRHGKKEFLTFATHTTS
ncbi:MAG: hypothetical protein OEY91_03670 [Nitrospirota bacterium]|nr:hypothetical protein [Nitrospirota bacterium]